MRMYLAWSSTSRAMSASSSTPSSTPSTTPSSTPSSTPPPPVMPTAFPRFPDCVRGLHAGIEKMLSPKYCSERDKHLRTPFACIPPAEVPKLLNPAAKIHTFAPFWESLDATPAEKQRWLDQLRSKARGELAFSTDQLPPTLEAARDLLRERAAYLLPQVPHHAATTAADIRDWIRSGGFARDALKAWRCAYGAPLISVHVRPEDRNGLARQVGLDDAVLLEPVEFKDDGSTVLLRGAHVSARRRMAPPPRRLVQSVPFEIWNNYYTDRVPFCFAYYSVLDRAHGSFRVVLGGFERATRRWVELAVVVNPDKNAERLRELWVLVYLLRPWCDDIHETRTECWVFRDAAVGRAPLLDTPLTFKDSHVYFGDHDGVPVRKLIHAAEHGGAVVKWIVFDRDTAGWRQIVRDYAAHLRKIYGALARSRLSSRTSVLVEQVGACVVRLTTRPMGMTEVSRFLKAADVAKMTSDILEQLAELHDELGMVHRDVAQRNVVYSLRSSRYELIDFDDAAFLDAEGICQAPYLEHQFHTMHVDRRGEEPYGCEIDVRAALGVAAEFLDWYKLQSRHPWFHEFAQRRHRTWKPRRGEQRQSTSALVEEFQRLVQAHVPGPAGPAAGHGAASAAAVAVRGGPANGAGGLAAASEAGAVQHGGEEATRVDTKRKGEGGGEEAGGEADDDGHASKRLKVK